MLRDGDGAQYFAMAPGGWPLSLTYLEDRMAIVSDATGGELLLYEPNCSNHTGRKEMDYGMRKNL